MTQNSLFGITPQIDSADIPANIPASQNFQPFAKMKVFPMLYVLDTNGRLRSWEICVEDRENAFAVVMKHGLADGAKVPNEYIVSNGTNIGRSNERSPFEQACFEAEAKWNAQLRSGYVVNARDAKKDTLGSGIPAPMLAKSYSPDGSMKGSKTLEKLGVLGKKICVQPKLDGNRCLAKLTPNGVELYTRKGDRFLKIPHIEEQLRECYLRAEKDSRVELILDGELFSKEMTFNAMNGLLRKESKSPSDFQLLESVEYHIYDIICEARYSVRYELIKEYYNRNLQLIPSFPIEATDENIREKMNEFLAAGYEGLMIRTLDTPYENKRSWSLCKYKDFQDAEYRVIDIIEDVRATGIIGAFVLELETPSIDREGRAIKTFNAGIKDLSHDEARKILANKQSYIGKFATVEFFELSEYGIPRFGKLKGFRPDDDIV